MKKSLSGCLLCPRCASSAVRRSHRRGLERLLSLLAVYPFRCESCHARFWQLAVGGQERGGGGVTGGFPSPPDPGQGGVRQTITLSDHPAPRPQPPPVDLARVLLSLMTGWVITHEGLAPAATAESEATPNLVDH